MVNADTTWQFFAIQFPTLTNQQLSWCPLSNHKLPTAKFFSKNSHPMANGALNADHMNTGWTKSVSHLIPTQCGLHAVHNQFKLARVCVCPVPGEETSCNMKECLKLQSRVKPVTGMPAVKLHYKNRKFVTSYNHLSFKYDWSILWTEVAI